MRRRSPTGARRTDANGRARPGRLLPRTPAAGVLALFRLRVALRLRLRGRLRRRRGLELAQDGPAGRAVEAAQPLFEPPDPERFGRAVLRVAAHLAARR